jgi:hypothetical protein
LVLPEAHACPNLRHGKVSRIPGLTRGNPSRGISPAALAGCSAHDAVLLVEMVMSKLFDGVRKSFHEAEKRSQLVRPLGFTLMTEEFL